MKLFLPQIKEEFTLEKDWGIELRQDTIRTFFNKEIKKESTQIIIPAGTKMFLTRMHLLNKRKIGGVGLMISELNGKKIKKALYHDFMVDLNDLNRMHIESSSTQGVLNIDVGWDINHSIAKNETFPSKYHKIGDQIGKGFVNHNHNFTIYISDIEYESYRSSWNKSDRVKIKNIK